MTTFVYLYVLKQSFTPIVLSIHLANVTVKLTSIFSKRFYDNNGYNAMVMTFCVGLICFEVPPRYLCCYYYDNYYFIQNVFPEYYRSCCKFKLKTPTTPTMKTPGTPKS